MSNQALEDYLENAAIKTFRCDVGDKMFWSACTVKISFLVENKVGILSSHFAKTGDALVAALAVMHCVLTEKQKASQLFNPFELYPQMLHNMKIDNKLPLRSFKGMLNWSLRLRQRKFVYLFVTQNRKFIAYFA